MMRILLITIALILLPPRHSYCQIKCREIVKTYLEVDVEVRKEDSIYKAWYEDLDSGLHKAIDSLRRSGYLKGKTPSEWKFRTPSNTPSNEIPIQDMEEIPQHTQM